MSRGVMQFDMWGVTPSDRWDWERLRAQVSFPPSFFFFFDFVFIYITFRYFCVCETQVIEHGTRNSLLTAPMPTASTSQILGNNECFEPYTSNL